MKSRLLGSCIVVLMLAVWPGAMSARAQAATGELARKLANPLSSLISVPLQLNEDGGFGRDDLERSTFNVQPVVPIALGNRARFKLISRTVVPFVQQEGAWAGEEISGIGDLTQSLFITPVSPTSGGWMIGVGPVAQLPTGSKARLTTDRWSVGPTAIAVRQVGPWVYGALANHLWSIAGDDRAAVSTTFVQPYVNYVTPTRTTLALNTEATRDWERETWSIPMHFIVNQLVRVGRQPMSVFVGARYWAASPDQGPEGMGFRFGTTLLFAQARPKADDSLR